MRNGTWATYDPQSDHSELSGFTHGISCTSHAPVYVAIAISIRVGHLHQVAQQTGAHFAVPSKVSRVSCLFRRVVWSM